MKKRDQEKSAYVFVLTVVSFIALFVLGRLGWVNAQEGVKLREEKDRLSYAKALSVRWEANSYAPSVREIKVWLEYLDTIDQEKRCRGRKFWTGLWDLEGEGNPTSKPRIDGGRSRGLGSIQIGATADTCAREGRKIPSRTEVALYNPLFNTWVMVSHFEYLVDKYGITSRDESYDPIMNSRDFPIAWACLAYNCGEGVADDFRRRGVKPRFTHYRKLCERIAEIDELIEKQERRR